MTNGIPKRANKNGELEANTVVNQKTAKPHHKRLNGIINMSAARKTIPFLGCPAQMSFSLLSKCSCSSLDVLKSINFVVLLLLFFSSEIKTVGCGFTFL